MDKCMKYCQRAAINKQILNLKMTNHFYFKNVTILKIPWNYKEFNGPPTNSFLRQFPNDYKFSFDETGCNNIAAFCVEGVVSTHCQFPVLNGNLICESKLNDNKVPFCQDNCFNANQPLDVYYDKKFKSCKLVNLPKKIFCLKPSNDNTIPPLLWNQKLNECFMSAEYCQYFGLSFDSKNNDCYLPGVQSFFEKYIFGKTLVRGIVHPTLIFNHAITDKIISPYSCSQISAELNVSDVARKFSDITEELLIASTPEITLHVSNLSLQYLYRFTKNLGGSLSKNIILFEMNNIVTDTIILNTLKVLGVCTKFTTNWELFIVYFVGFALDILDTLNLNKAMTSLDFKTLMDHFDKTFNEKFSVQTVTPEILLNIETIKLKLKKKIHEAYDLKYGGIKNLVNVVKCYTEDIEELSNSKFGDSYREIFSNFKILNQRPEIIPFIITTLILCFPLGTVSLILVVIILVVTMVLLLTMK